MLIEYTRSQVMALKDLIVEYLTLPEHREVYIDVAHDVHTTPEELLQKLTVPKLRLRIVLDHGEVILNAQRGYVLRGTAEGDSITCLGCGFTSHSAKDVEQRYCGHCHVFHDERGTGG